MSDKGKSFVVKVSDDPLKNSNRFMKPSLRRRAVVKIAVAIWTRYYLTPLSENNFPKHSEMRYWWQANEQYIMLKVDNLELLMFRDEIKEIAGSIGYRILAWVALNEWYHITAPVPKEFVWTPQGTINLKQTAEALLDKKIIVDADVRYKLACVYCLNDRISSLWQEVSAKFRNLEYVRTTETPIVSYWSYKLEDSLDSYRQHIPDENTSVEEYLFQDVAKGGNELAIRYLMRKFISEDEKGIVEDCVIAIAKTGVSIISIRGYKEEYYGDILSLLIFAMTQEQRKRVFKKCLPDILEWFIEYPCHVYFLPALEGMWDFLSESSFETLLLTIHSKCTYAIYDYKNLFRTFWGSGPETHKKHVRRKYEYSSRKCPDDAEYFVALGKPVKIFKSEFVQYLKCAEVPR